MADHPKPLTTTEASLRLNAAFGRMGAALARMFRQPTLASDLEHGARENDRRADAVRADIERMANPDV